MFGLIRRLSLVIPLLLAIGVPFAMMSESTNSIRDSISSLFSGRSSADGEGSTTDADINGILSQVDQAAAGRPGDRVTSTPIANLETVLRFDISPRWVLDNWPSVSTTRNEGDLDGLRVPLITGTRPEDVTGALTYYFDKNQQVQRIALDGVVGDDRHVVSMVTRTFQLQPEPRAGLGLYVAKWNGDPTSALWVRRLATASTGNSLRRFEVALELNRPSNYFGLSPEFRARLGQGQASSPAANPVR